MDPIIEKHIAENYKKWLDYARFFSQQGGIPDEAEDVLQEVIIMVLAKGEPFILKLLKKPAQKSCKTQLDAYVLRLLKMNAVSNTAPYKNRYKVRYNTELKDSNVDLSRFDLIDEDYEDVPSIKELQLEQFRQVREVFDVIRKDCDPYDAMIFEARFFDNIDMVEIAHDLGIKVQKGYNCLNRILMAIKTYITTGSYDFKVMGRNGKMKKMYIKRHRDYLSV